MTAGPVCRAREVRPAVQRRASGIAVPDDALVHVAARAPVADDQLVVAVAHCPAAAECPPEALPAADHPAARSSLFQMKSRRRGRRRRSHRRRSGVPDRPRAARSGTSTRIRTRSGSCSLPVSLSQSSMSSTLPSLSKSPAMTRRSRSTTPILAFSESPSAHVLQVPRSRVDIPQHDLVLYSVAVQVARDRTVEPGRERRAPPRSGPPRFHHDTASRQAEFRSHSTCVSGLGWTSGADAPIRRLGVRATMVHVDVDVVVVADSALAHVVPRRDAAVALAVPASIVEQDLLDAEPTRVGVRAVLRSPAPAASSRSRGRAAGCTPSSRFPRP